MRVSTHGLILAVFALSACATPAQMTTGPSVLGAEGQVKVADGPNGNTLVNILIHHLAAPEKVSPGATVYVAWVQASEGGSQQNVGQIQLDSNQSGRLDTVTSFKNFTVIVTAEPVATAATPTGNPVLSTKISGKQ